MEHNKVVVICKRCTKMNMIFIKKQSFKKIYIFTQRHGFGNNFMQRQCFKKTSHRGKASHRSKNKILQWNQTNVQHQINIVEQVSNEHNGLMKGKHCRHSCVTQSSCYDENVVTLCIGNLTIVVKMMV